MIELWAIHDKRNAKFDKKSYPILDLEEEIKNLRESFVDNPDEEGDQESINFHKSLTLKMEESSIRGSILGSPTKRATPSRDRSKHSSRMNQ